jgi:rhamnosyltransferase
MIRPSQTPKPRIAILLAAFNGTCWLNEQVESILNQTGVSLTLFISVDQSNDGTEALVDQLAQEDSRIQVLAHGEHFGGAGANFFRLFKSIDFSQHDYVALSDQDDIWNLDKLQRAVTALQANQCEGYSANVTAFWADGEKQFLDRAQKQVQWDFLFEAAGPGCSYFLTQSLALDFQSFLITHWHSVEKVQFHDWLLYAFARANQRNWFIDSESSLLYRQHANNQFGASVGLSAFLMRAKKVLNGWGLGQSKLIAKAVGLGDSPFAISWSEGTRLGYLKLGSQFLKCRRRTRDKLLFLFACLSLSLFPPK